MSKNTAQGIAGLLAVWGFAILVAAFLYEAGALIYNGKTFNGLLLMGGTIFGVAIVVEFTRHEIEKRAKDDS